MDSPKPEDCPEERSPEGLKYGEPLLDEIINLQRIAYHARYGDAFEEACKRLRLEEEAEKVISWGVRSQGGWDWSKTDQELTREKETWRRVLRGEQLHKKCPTHMAIAGVCGAAGFDTEEVLALVHLYATRHEIVQADFQTVIRDGFFHDLAYRLHGDLCDVPRVVSATETVQAKLMSRLLRGMIDRWYTHASEDCDNVQSWIRTGDLTALRLELRAEDASPEVYKRMIRDIVKDVCRKIRNEARDTKMREEKIQEFLQEHSHIVADRVRPIKFVSLDQFEEEKKKADQAKRDWDRLVESVDEFRKAAQEFQREYGPSNDPLFMTHNLSWDSESEDDGIVEH